MTATPRAPLKGICFANRIQGHSGPAAFQRRLAAAVQARGLEVAYRPRAARDRPTIIVGGTRRIPPVWRAKRAGALVVQRLNGMNWIHRRLPTGVMHYLKAEWSNWLLRFTRRRVADAIVYQSEFVRAWWEREAGPVPAPSRVIYNGVPLDRFRPDGALPNGPGLRVLVVEGNIGGGYQIGLEWGVELASRLALRLDRAVTLAIAGNVAPGGQRNYPQPSVEWLGVLTPDQVAHEHRRAHLLYASDLNPACPNSVLEAMASGLPVLAFATGALPELIGEAAGVLVDYGADPWRVEGPDLDGLAAGAERLLDARGSLSSGARRIAEERFGLELMATNYLGALEEWRA